MRKMLQRLKSQRPSREAILAALSEPRFSRLRLDNFPNGIDQTRIDVALSPALVRVTEVYVSALLREAAQRLWDQPVSDASENLADAFRGVLREQARAVVKEARGPRAVERVQLFQLALWKQVFATFDEALAALRRELEDARDDHDREGQGARLHYHQQAVILAQHVDPLSYRVLHGVMRQLMRVEHGGLRNLRQSVLGLSWPVPEEMLENPMLLLSGRGGLREFADHYPAMLYGLGTACGASTCLFDVLGEWLPEGLEALSPGPDDAGASVKTSPSDRVDRDERPEIRLWARRVLQDDEREDDVVTWLDQPENGVLLLGGAEPDWPQSGPSRLPGMATLQRELSRRFIARLGRAGLWPAVEASYALAAIYPTLGLRDGEVVILDYLQGVCSRRELGRWLSGRTVKGGANAMLRRIDDARKAFLADPRAGRAQLAARLAGDLLRLRRDLRLARRALDAMGRIRLLQDPDEFTLSRSHKVLQAFGNDLTAEDHAGDAVGHVILKVEIRGTHALSADMRRRKLSPASYFSRYLFDPLERERQRFAARKVAVDGESVLLTITEHDGTEAEHLAVARACGLALQILAMVNRMNAESERQGLRTLELGMGIAYSDEPPTFLYDQARRVMVSPATAAARRMAGCHRVLRESGAFPAGSGVWVASPAGMQPAGSGQDDGLVHYNVDGIELDAAAFARLNVELLLRKVKVRDPQGRQPSRLYVGQCPDVKGDVHWLVVRERRIRLWMGRQLLEAENEERSYYELVTEPKMVARMRRLLSDGDPQTADGARQ